MAETFLALFIGIIAIVLTSFICCILRISTMCDEEEELWQKRKRKK